MLGRSAWLFAVLGACNFSASVSGSAGGDGGDGIIDASTPSLDGEVVGECTPGDPPSCDGMNLLECNADGELVAFECRIGCIENPEARCEFASPRSPVTDDALSVVTGGLDASVESLVLNTTDGSIETVGGANLRGAVMGLDQDTGIHFMVVSQGGGPDIGVFSVASVTVGPAQSIEATSENALAIVSAGDVLIQGLIDLDGGCTGGDRRCAGSGGFRGGNSEGDGAGPHAGGGASGPNGMSVGEPGGGGAGFGTAGARGGDGLNQANDQVAEPGGSAGSSEGNDALVPLRGGSGGGGGGDEGTLFSDCVGFSRDGGRGGGGGGALQLFSRTRIELSSAGAPCGISASGAGAGGGGCGAGGGGAGAGGGLLLEASRVDVQAMCFVVANGGGGSGGHFSEPGEVGNASAAAAGSLGAAFAGNPSGNGGSGAYLQNNATPGESNAFQAGGGGGGAGIVRIQTADGTSLFSSGVITPVPAQASVGKESD